jgi:pyruvate,water dikinase
MEILWLGEPACHDRAAVGGKAARLSRLAAAYRVPPGFCLTTAAYDRWGDATARGPSAGLREHLGAAYRRLAEVCGEEGPRVAVRSSIPDEDGNASSFAGQHASYINIDGVEAIAAAAERCWASARSARALTYRRRRGLPVGNVRPAVLVQQMVAADVAAVVFSANPVTGDRGEIVINASWGLGQSIGDGTVTPDTYLVRKADHAIAARRIAEKRCMSVLVPGGTREEAVPRRLRARPALDDGQVADLARLALSLESALGRPVDLECAFADGAWHLLQCRPITALSASRH